MNVLEDSPLEALAFNFNYSTFDFLNNLWTWLAVVTAAVGFWKVRAAKPQLLPPPDVRSDPAPEVLEPEAACVPKMVADNGGDDVDGLTKGKFTFYYEDDREWKCESDDMLTVTEEWVEKGGCEAEWWEGWERLLRLREGQQENGWYTCQDLTALNGNVVRLWDGEFN